MSKELKCKECNERTATCHGECTYYLEWQEQHKEEKKNERKQKWLKNLGLPEKFKKY